MQPPVSNNDQDSSPEARHPHASISHMQPLLVLLAFAFIERSASQQIWDIWQTTWDRSKLFTSLSPSAPINFVSKGPIGSASILVNEANQYQSILGFGGSLTESAALTLSKLKDKNSSSYRNLLNYLISPTDANAASLSYIRVSIGASDFSERVYSLADAGDPSFSDFDINRTPSYLFSVLKDIIAVNNQIKVHILPWSPPGWMKDSNTMNGGSIKPQYVNAYPTYLLKAVQGFQSQGIKVYAISIQNEPQNGNPTYPTCIMTPSVEGQIGSGLRALLNNSGLSGVKIVGYEHNWDNAGAHPVQLMQSAGNAFAGVAFHCYAGNVGNQDAFHNAFPSKEIYFTECTGTFGSDWWSDMKWYMDKLFIGSLEHNSQTVLMWNIALDGTGNPRLPGSDSCGGPGCRPLVTVNGDGSWSVNQELYAMAQAAKATIPRDAGGPPGRRVGVSVGGSLGWGLRVGAYVTGRASPSDWPRYSLVVMNWNDNANSNWNPVPVTTTIEFRGLQATYTFPVGVTTLWWYAPVIGSSDAKGRFAINGTSTSNTTANPTETIAMARNASSSLS
ncbi:hypothetical protein HGRIS_010396 [Hohenbuehelia grisea]|uniref:Glycosyl hydrolase family 30 TIM-barrel domain-containing protein n=1 Tax=Hohenbuehelia grisea TaxID=104357 RepID=A0ABR3J4L9_9AGAR